MKGVELRACDAGSTEHASRVQSAECRVQTEKATAGEVDSGVDYGTMGLGLRDYCMRP